VTATPRAVVFDCDGLLIDSEVRWAVAERRVVEGHGGAWLPELRERMVGGSGDHTAHCIADWLGLPETAAPGILHEVYTGYLAVLDELGVEPMAGAHALVSAVAGRLPIAVASNTREETVRATLAASGLPAVFDLVFTPGQGRRAKPEPDVYLAACEALEVAPADGVAFEDSPPGVAAARAAGMFVVAVPSDGIHELEADLVLGSLLDLDLAVLGL
jgi:HAD superfamily hydrolase (TIGR01509 family)